MESPVCPCFQPFPACSLTASSSSSAYSTYSPTYDSFSVYSPSYNLDTPILEREDNTDLSQPRSLASASSFGSLTSYTPSYPSTAPTTPLSSIRRGRVPSPIVSNPNYSTCFDMEWPLTTVEHHHRRRLLPNPHLPRLCPGLLVPVNLAGRRSRRPVIRSSSSSSLDPLRVHLQFTKVVGGERAGAQ